MKSKYYLVTGASSGIGYSAVRIMAKNEPKSFFIIPVRSDEKGEEVQESLRKESGNSNIFYLKTDLSSFTEVRALAEEVKSRCDHLDVLVNNAGVYMEKKTITSDRLEMTYQVNYFSPFLLSYLLADHIAKSEEGRIVNVSSVGHKLARKFEPQQLLDTKTFNGFLNYAVSKLALILFTNQFSKILLEKNITVNSLHPGGVSTNIARKNGFFNVMMKWLGSPADQGASPIIYLSQSPEARQFTGKYFDQEKRSPASTSRLAQSPSLEKALYDFTLEYLNLPPL